MRSRAHETDVFNTKGTKGTKTFLQNASAAKSHRVFRECFFVFFVSFVLKLFVVNSVGTGFSIADPPVAPMEADSQQQGARR